MPPRDFAFPPLRLRVGCAGATLSEAFPASPENRLCLPVECPGTAPASVTRKSRATRVSRTPGGRRLLFSPSLTAPPTSMTRRRRRTADRADRRGHAQRAGEPTSRGRGLRSEPSPGARPRAARLSCEAAPTPSAHALLRSVTPAGAKRQFGWIRPGGPGSLDNSLDHGGPDHPFVVRVTAPSATSRYRHAEVLSPLLDQAVIGRRSTCWAADIGRRCRALVNPVVRFDGRTHESR